MPASTNLASPIPASVTDDDDLWVTLSEVEHWLYCPRQWAIIHLEQCFVDNDDTTRGQLAHKRADALGHQIRGCTTTLWSVDVVSEERGIRGRCDRILVDGNRVIPVEHKSGGHHHPAFAAQLVGQAVCLEEMRAAPVTLGRIYFVATNTYLDVDVGNSAARTALFDAVTAIRAARTTTPRLPTPAADERCVSCSLKEVCLPDLVSHRRRQRGLFEASRGPDF
jgi:CRISPR-associated exonuclease Cas4